MGKNLCKSSCIVVILTQNTVLWETNILYVCGVAVSDKLCFMAADSPHSQRYDLCLLICKKSFSIQTGLSTFQKFCLNLVSIIFSYGKAPCTKERAFYHLVILILVYKCLATILYCSFDTISIFSLMTLI